MPTLGTAVSFPGNTVIGACEGTVVKHYPGYRGKNEDGEFVVALSILSDQIEESQSSTHTVCKTVSISRIASSIASGVLDASNLS